MVDLQAAFVFWNCHGVNNLWDASDVLGNAAVIGISETWLEQDPKSVPHWIDSNYKCVWSHATREADRGRGSGGLALLVSREFEVTIVEISSWWIFVRINAGSSSIIIA